MSPLSNRLRLLAAVVAASVAIACSTTTEEPASALSAPPDTGSGVTDAGGPPDARDDGAPDADGDAGADDAGTIDGGPADTDPPSCEPNPCSSPDRMRCVATDAGIACLCNAGTHDDGGVCVPDETCTETSCSGHGTCEDGGGTLGCTCAEGYAGARCEKCDEGEGWHPDGAGGCTTDVCVPSPCTASHTHCEAGASGATCVCDAGFHMEGGVCVVDETCTSSTCSGHGACSLVLGKTACACDEGYEGPTCATCAPTHHPDGAGACTTDPCAPNPCTTIPMKDVCVGDATKTSGYRCECAAGTHDDGVGGCTADPCKPNPCLASNQACKDEGSGAYTCYTPECDDANPCTTDTIVSGVCQHVPVGDGTACSTSLCLTGQTCSGGSCQGGAPIVCDDGDGCTRDSCDALTGCKHVKDDTLIPDDGVACTVDSCVGGVAKHVAADARCDDALWCTGVEQCKPSDPSADADGCVHVSVPKPPVSWGPCKTFGACDEATKSFPPITEPVGAACDDGLACTIGDQCAPDGACRGSVVATCTSSTTCASTSALPSTLDLGIAKLSGALTLSGGAIPATSKGGDVDLYLVNEVTGSRQRIGGPRYSYSSGTYVLVSGTNAYSTIVTPGIYDVLYRRGWNHADSGAWTYTTTAGDSLADGEQYLARDFVVGPGDNTLDLDFGIATVSGSFTLKGGPVPTTSKGGDVDVYLVNKETGSRQRIGGPRYSYSSGTYVLVSGTDAYSTLVMPGTYDVLYRRGWSWSAGGAWTYTTTAGDTLADGEQYLARDVVIPSGAKTLDLDFGRTSLSGAFTLSGGPVPSTSKGGDVDVYLINKATGSRQRVGGPRYSYSSGTYVLVSGTDAYSTLVMPGTYDVVYRRGWNFAAGGSWVYTTTAGDTLADGDVYLARDVVVGGDAQTLDVDFGIATISGTFTLDGGAVPTTSKGGDVDVYLVNVETGSRQRIGGPRYSYSSGTYVLVSGTSAYSTLVMPGTYDVLYRRGWNAADGGAWVYTTTAGDTLADGDQILLRDVVVSGASKTLDVDFGRTVVGGAFTLAGGAIPTTSKGGDVDVYFVNKVTGSRQRIGGPRYSYSSGTYVLVSGTDAYSSIVMPGTYDVLFRRGWNYAAGGSWVYTTTAGDTLPDADQILRACIVIP